MLYSQIVLTPTEAKKLLTKAVLNLDEVKKALDSGMLIVHPSSTTIFMLDELGFTLPPENIWICGHISPKGLCISRGMVDAILEIPDYTVDKYPFEFIIRKGKLLPFEERALGPARWTFCNTRSDSSNLACIESANPRLIRARLPIWSGMERFSTISPRYCSAFE